MFYKTDRKTEFSDAQLQSVKNKIKTVLTFLISQHLQKGGVYFEVRKSTDIDGGIVYTKSTKPARTLAGLLLPYVLWVLNEYVKRIHGVDPLYFTFQKTPDQYIENIFHLDFNVEQAAIPDITTILMFLVVVFQDRFESDHVNRVQVNRLCYLLEK